MKRLSEEQILMLHSQLIQQTGGSDGVRDYDLLESALETPFQSFGGKELYPTIQAKAETLELAKTILQKSLDKKDFPVSENLRKRILSISDLELIMNLNVEIAKADSEEEIEMLLEKLKF